MISSTALDLPDHRKAVQDAVLRAGCAPLAMETGTAASGMDAVRYSLAMVDRADVYIGIFGHRYGHVPEDPLANPRGWSVTEHEYRHAVGRRLPILGYLMRKDHPVTIEDIDLDPAKVAKLAALKDDLRQGVCAFFNSPQDLERLVIQSLFEEKEKLGRAPAPAAPNKAAFVPRPPELYAVPPYTLTNLFVGRQVELAQLDLWAAATDPVMVVEAIGGMGKSALTWNWVQERAADRIPGLAGRIWWSFYERGTSMKTFLRHALAYVTRQGPETLLKLSTYDCGQALLSELRARPYLLVLDGFERVLAAYHRLDKAQVADAKVATDKRECTNPADGEVLRQLVACHPSKVLVSTRLMPIALQDRRTHRAIPGVTHWEIDGLNQEDALHLVREAGVRGDATAIERLAREFDRHPLVLRIVCGMITDYRPRPGDFNAWRADPHAGGGLKLSELPLKQRYTHILEYAFRGLGEKTRQVLSRIAVLSDAADYATIAVLNPFLPPRSFPPSGDNRQAVADFHAALTDLEDRGLLQWDRQANSYDLHPVVRGYAFEQLEAPDRNQAYRAIRDHFADLPPEDLEQATELFQVRNSLEIMRALLGSGRFDEAHSFYRGSLSYCLMFLIGGYHAIVELMTPLVVSEPRAEPVLADKTQLSLAMNELAGALSLLGRNEEAHPLYRDALRLDLAAKDWGNLVSGLDNLSLNAWRLNRLAESKTQRELALDLAQAAGLGDLITVLLAEAMDEASIFGEFAEAESKWTAFQRRQRPRRSLYGPGTAEHRFARLRFFQGKLAQADLDRAAQASSVGGPSEVGLQHSLPALAAEWQLTLNDPRTALELIEAALATVRRVGVPASDHLGLRALALARLGRAAEAREALAEAEDAGDMALRFPLFAAEAWLTLADPDRAREWALRAYALAWAGGPPYIRWYDLNRCRALLAALDEPEPQLPPFDPARIEPTPCEAEIRTAIDALNDERARKNQEGSDWR